MKELIQEFDLSKPAHAEALLEVLCKNDKAISEITIAINFDFDVKQTSHVICLNALKENTTIKKLTLKLNQEEGVEMDDPLILEILSKHSSIQHLDIIGRPILTHESRLTLWRQWGENPVLLSIKLDVVSFKFDTDAIYAQHNPHISNIAFFESFKRCSLKYVKEIYLNDIIDEDMIFICQVIKNLKNVNTFTLAISHEQSFIDCLQETESENEEKYMSICLKEAIKTNETLLYFNIIEKHLDFDDTHSDSEDIDTDDNDIDSIHNPIEKDFFEFLQIDQTRKILLQKFENFRSLITCFYAEYHHDFKELELPALSLKEVSIQKAIDGTQINCSELPLDLIEFLNVFTQLKYEILDNHIRNFDVARYFQSPEELEKRDHLIQKFNFVSMNMENALLEFRKRKMQHHSFSIFKPNENKDKNSENKKHNDLPNYSPSFKSFN